MLTPKGSWSRDDIRNHPWLLRCGCNLQKLAILCWACARKRLFLRAYTACIQAASLCRSECFSVRIRVTSVRSSSFPPKGNALLVFIYFLRAVGLRVSYLARSPFPIFNCARSRLLLAFSHHATPTRGMEMCRAQTGQGTKM